MTSPHGVGYRVNLVNLQSVALAPLAGQRKKRPKLTTDLDDANHGDSTKQAIVAVLVENTDGDPGDLVVWKEIAFPVPSWEE